MSSAGSEALSGVTVVEITSPATALVGRSLVDFGSHVLLVEAEELSSSVGRRSFRQLIERADVLVEAEPPGRLAELGLDYIDLTRRSHQTGHTDATPGPPAVNDRLIHVSISPFGRTGRGPIADTTRQQPMTDLTVKARAGWLGLPQNPKDDGQSSPTSVAAQMAVMGTLTALIAREQHGSQFVDVSILAAANLCAGPRNLYWMSTQTDRIPRRRSANAEIALDQPLS